MSYSQTRLEEMFFAALELPPSERPGFINRTCENDFDLKQKLEVLLISDQSADERNFLQSSAFEENAAAFAPDFLADAWIGKIVGHYEILERIGAGGMGAIYLATRTDDYEKRAAVKIIKRGMDSEAILRRFRNERQILANLEHPNIARLIDGGTTADGLPFFVMEFIEGVPVDEYCRAENLAEAQRLALFRKICQAVSFAHQKLVVHRDLKPSNILVTPEGEPKLLDFGIARLLDSTDAATLTEARALTPAYASPEQRRGEIVGTTSDVYSLGVILSELVHCPLSGDLRTILQTAVREDAARRYGSVEAFSEDLRRYLAGLPIAARKDSAAYRASKFVRRNRLAVAVAGLFVLSLIGGIAATSYQAAVAGRERARADEQRERAERRSENLRKISNSFVVELHDEIIKLPGSLPARQLLLRRGIEQLDALAAESEGNAALQDELAQGYYNLGEMPDLNLAEIERNHQKGAAIYQTLLENDAENPQYRVGLAHGFSRLANVQKMRGDITEALNYSRRASQILEAVAAAEPANSEFQTALFGSYYETAGLLNFTGEARASLEEARRAFAVAENLARRAPENEDYREMMNHSRSVIAASLSYLGDYENALVHIRAVHAATAARHQKQPENVVHRYGMWAINRRLGTILAADGQTAAALESMQTALGFIQTLHAESSSDDGYQRNASYTHLTVGQTLIRANQFEKALPHLRRALGLSEKLFAKDSERGETIGDLGAIHSNLGEALTRIGSRAEGLRHLRESLAFYEKSRAAVADNVFMRRDYAETLARLGAALETDSTPENNRREAAEFYRRSLELWRAMQKRGILSGADANKPDEIAGEIEKIS